MQIGDDLNRLTDEHIEARSQAYKRRAHAQAEALLDAAPERIAGLADGEAYRVLEASADRSLPPEPFLDAMERRADRFGCEVRFVEGLRAWKAFFESQ